MPEPAVADPSGPAAPGPRLRDWLGRPRASVVGGRLVIRYARGVVGCWIGLAVAGLVIGFGAVGSDGSVEAGYIAFGMAAICTFVAWFAVRPAVVADAAGIALQPLFASREPFAWHEVRAIGVREVRAARGRGPALVLDGADEREARIDGLWVGATRGALLRMQADLEVFVASLDVAPPRFVAEHPDDGLDPSENENTF